MWGNPLGGIKLSQVYVFGPCQHFCGTGAGGTLEFLGYTESDTIISLDHEVSEVMIDYSGDKIPGDLQHMGIQAHVKGTLVRYNEAVFNRLQSRVAGGTAGVVGTYDIGGLYFAQGLGIRYLLYGGYSQNAAFSTMTGSYNFPVCLLEGTCDVSASTRVKKASISIRALVDWTVTGTGATGVLWNTDDSGRPSIN